MQVDGAGPGQGGVRDSGDKHSKHFCFKQTFFQDNLRGNGRRLGSLIWSFLLLFICYINIISMRMFSKFIFVVVNI